MPFPRVSKYQHNPEEIEIHNKPAYFDSLIKHLADNPGVVKSLTFTEGDISVEQLEILLESIKHHLLKDWIYLVISWVIMVQS